MGKMKKDYNEVFDYKMLRFLVGIIALILPLMVRIFSHNDSLPSISASYYSGARGVFTGSLFMVGTFLLAYKGHDSIQNLMSTIAGICAILTAFFPTSCPGNMSIMDMIYRDAALLIPPGIIVLLNENFPSNENKHFIAALTLFIILAYFCFYPFRKSAQEKMSKAEKGSGERTKAMIRMWLYIACGMGILFSLAYYGYFHFIIKMPVGELENTRILFRSEKYALIAFGIAWFTAGREIPINMGKKTQSLLRNTISNKPNPQEPQ